jgi:hypothetical protein
VTRDTAISSGDDGDLRKWEGEPGSSSKVDASLWSRRLWSSLRGSTRLARRSVISRVLGGHGSNLLGPALRDQHLREGVRQIDDLADTHRPQIDAVQRIGELSSQPDTQGYDTACKDVTTAEVRFY